MLKKMPGLDKSKEESRSITTIQVGLSHLLKILHPLKQSGFNLVGWLGQLPQMKMSHSNTLNWSL